MRSQYLVGDYEWRLKWGLGLAPLSRVWGQHQWQGRGAALLAGSEGSIQINSFETTQNLFLHTIFTTSSLKEEIRYLIHFCEEYLLFKCCVLEVWGAALLAGSEGSVQIKAFETTQNFMSHTILTNLSFKEEIRYLIQFCEE